MPGCFSVMLWLFLLTYFIFCYFFTSRKFCKLLFTGKRGKVCYFLLLFLLLVTFVNYFFIVQGSVMGN
jgi:hypothetical protein